MKLLQRALLHDWFSRQWVEVGGFGPCPITTYYSTFYLQHEVIDNSWHSTIIGMLGHNAYLFVIIHSLPFSLKTTTPTCLNSVIALCSLGPPDGEEFLVKTVTWSWCPAQQEAASVARSQYCWPLLFEFLSLSRSNSRRNRWSLGISCDGVSSINVSQWHAASEDEYSVQFAPCDYHAWEERCFGKSIESE